MRSQNPLKYASEFYIIITRPTTTQQKPGLNNGVIFDVVLLIALHPLDRSSDHKMSLPPNLFPYFVANSIAKTLFPTDFRPDSIPSPYSRHLIDV